MKLQAPILELFHLCTASAGYKLILDIGMGKARTIVRLGLLLLFLHSILCIRPATAQPSAPLYADEAPNPAITARAGPELALPSNITISFPGGWPQMGILCFEAAQGRETTSIDGCRPTLNRLRALPLYRLVQEFQEGAKPKVPSKPPYIFHVKDSTCGIQLACGSTTITDKFSFEQVRALATDILEDCQSKGGYGGVAPLGKGVGWTVKVIGHTTADARQKDQATRGRYIA